jgi:hypothetical protein
MPKIVDPRGVVRAAVAPAQLPAQLTEDAMDLAVAQWQPAPSASGTDEERGLLRGRPARQVAHPAIPPQGLHRAGVHGHLARLAELGAVDAQHSGLEVDIQVAQRKRLADAQTRSGDQAEQRLEDGTAQAGRRAEPSCSGQQVDDLLPAVDVRRLSLWQPSEDRIVGHLGARLELLQPAHERAQLLQPPCPGMRVGAGMGVAARPVGHELYRQWTAVAKRLNVAREAAQGVCIVADGESQPSTIDQIALDARSHGGGRAHAALPGHGNATSASLRLSSLA